MGTNTLSMAECVGPTQPTEDPSGTEIPRCPGALVPDCVSWDLLSFLALDSDQNPGSSWASNLLAFGLELNPVDLGPGTMQWLSKSPQSLARLSLQGTTLSNCLITERGTERQVHITGVLPLCRNLTNAKTKPGLPSTSWLRIWVWQRSAASCARGPISEYLEQSPVLVQKFPPHPTPFSKVPTGSLAGEGGLFVQMSTAK